MRRTLLAAALGLAAFAGVLASANTLGGVDGHTLAAGGDLVASCDTDGVDLAYHSTYGDGDYLVTSVDVTGVDAACAGGRLDLTLADGDGSVTASTGDTVAGGTTTLTVSPGMPASEVARAAVVISGPGGGA